MAATTTRTKRTTTKAAAPEPEVIEEDEFEEVEDDEETTEVESDDDLEELDEDDDAEETPKPKAKKAAKNVPPKQPVVEFGSPWLAQYITDVTGETYDSRGIRMLLRKLAKDGKLQRVVGEDRGRYSFTGKEDPIVTAVIQMVQSGQAKELKQAGLQKVKDQAAAKKAAAKQAEAEAIEDEDMEEVEEETPKPTRRKTAAPAKATPAKATTRRKAPASA